MTAMASVTLLTVAEILALRIALGATDALHAFSVLGCLALNLICIGIWKVYIFPNFYSPLRGLPTAPGGHGPLGHVNAKFNAPIDTSLETWVETITNDGLIRVREAFGGDAVIATSPQMFKAVLLDDPYKFEKAHGIRKILRLVLGKGLIVVEGDAHKFQKSALKPSFGAGNIKDLYPVFWEKSSELLSTLSSSLTTDQMERVAFCQWCERVTLDIIGVAAFGKDFDTLHKPSETGLAAEYHELLKVDGHRALWFLLSFFLPESVVANIPFWQAPKVATRITSNLHTFALDMARQRRAELTAGLSVESKAESLLLRRPDILSVLVHDTNLSDDQLADQILTLLAAGHETTSSALAWASVALSQDQRIQGLLREEIRAHLPSPAVDESIAATTIERLPLLNAVCHETLRLYPTVPFTARTAVADTRLGDISLSKGAEVWLPIWATNRSPRFWGDDAAKFKPERWITNGIFNNNGGATSNYAQLTFLHGVRSCIGQGFAKAELRCLVAALIGRFQIELADDEGNYRPNGLVTVKPDNDGLLRMRVVDGW